MSDETQLGGTSVIAEPPVGIHRHPPTSFDHKEIHGLLTLSDLLDTYIGYRISTTNQKKTLDDQQEDTTANKSVKFHLDKKDHAYKKTYPFASNAPCGMKTTHKNKRDYDYDLTY